MGRDDGGELVPSPADAHDLPSGRCGICGYRGQEEKEDLAPFGWLQPKPRMRRWDSYTTL